MNANCLTGFGRNLEAACKSAKRAELIRANVAPEEGFAVCVRSVSGVVTRKVYAEFPAAQMAAEVVRGRKGVAGVWVESL